LDGLPEHIEIDVEVNVDQTVTHADDVGPRNCWQLYPCRLRYLLGGFANDLDSFYQPQHKHPIAAEIGACSPLSK
jgi:hypothetical protein